jgi:hypothetical protein
LVAARAQSRTPNATKKQAVCLFAQPTEFASTFNPVNQILA